MKTIQRTWFSAVLAVLVSGFGVHGVERIPGTADSLPQLMTGNGTFRLGKKPYPAGTREQWIKEGRVLASAFGDTPPAKKALKGAADNRAYLPPIADQGAEGACVHWAGAYYSQTAMMKRAVPSLDTTQPANQCSPRFTYNLVNSGADGGGYGHEPFEIAMRYGVASLQQVPYVAGAYAELPAAADFVEGLHRRTANYVWVWEWGPDSTQVNELKAFLDAGGVAVAGVYSSQTSFDNWRPGDQPWSGSVCTAESIDHMVTVCGYGTGYYLVANSWGTSFGSNGYIQVASDYFENYFSDVMYPLAGSYAPATSYAIVEIQHSYRSDISSMVFSVNGSTVWNHTPLPTDLPMGTGSLAYDGRQNWSLAVDLTSAPWSSVNVVSVQCMDQESPDTGYIQTFTIHHDGSDYTSADTPVAIPDNTGQAASASVSFSSTDPWDTGYTDLGGGWRRLTWFGDYVPMGSAGWIWHNKHGFFYVAASATPENIWFFAQDMGWLWTRSSVYPFLFRHNDRSWLWYNGATNPRWFVNMATGQWERHD